MHLTEKILVVDTDALTRKSLRAFLEELGMTVVEADRSELVLELCRRDPPDLVLLALDLAGKTGFEVCRSLKLQPELQAIPVIFISDNMETRDKLEAFAIGGVDYLTRPFQFKEVEARICTHLEVHWQRRQFEANRKSLQEALAEARQANHQLIAVNERLQQAEALKTHFLANVRNEINDPLGSILALADEICAPRLPVEQSRILASLIKMEAAHLAFNLRNIFCAAELEAGEASPAITRVDVASVLWDAAADWAGAVSRKGQTLAVQVAEGSNPFATDAGKLRLILGNLLANAIEFSPKGSRVELRALQQDGALVIEVEDQGSGLSEADLAVIFERFRQLETGHARLHKGQGLGLAVVKALVELLDGQILVASVPGRGSKFTCRLPSCALGEDLDSASFDGNLFIFDEPHEL